MLNFKPVTSHVVLLLFFLGCQCDAAGTLIKTINNGSKYGYCPEKKCYCRSRFTGRHCRCGRGSYDKDGTCKGMSNNTLKPAIFKCVRQKVFLFCKYVF